MHYCAGVQSVPQSSALTFSPLMAVCVHPQLAHRAHLSRAPAALALPHAEGEQGLVCSDACGQGSLLHTSGSQLQPVQALVLVASRSITAAGLQSLQIFPHPSMHHRVRHDSTAEKGKKHTWLRLRRTLARSGRRLTRQPRKYRCTVRAAFSRLSQ